MVIGPRKSWRYKILCCKLSELLHKYLASVSRVERHYMVYHLFYVNIHEISCWTLIAGKWTVMGMRWRFLTMKTSMGILSGMLLKHMCHPQNRRELFLSSVLVRWDINICNEKKWFINPSSHKILKFVSEKTLSNTDVSQVRLYSLLWSQELNCHSHWGDQVNGLHPPR